MPVLGWEITPQHLFSSSELPSRDRDTVAVSTGCILGEWADSVPKARAVLGASWQTL